MTPSSNSSSALSPPALDRLLKPEALKLLAGSDCSAFAAVVAAVCLFGDDILDDDNQPLDEGELRLMAEDLNLVIPDETCSRICGLLNSVAGDEFTTHPTHFERMVGAIIHGDPFVYEDDNDMPTLTDALWALFQAGLMTEDDDPMTELGPRVKAFLQRIADEEAEDIEEVSAAFEDEADGGESYEFLELRLRMSILASELRALGLEADDMRDTHAELADLMSAS